MRILLADDQPLLRTGFRMVLGAEGDLDVVAEAGDGVEAVELSRRLLPDVVLMDIRMPRMDGVAATRAIVDARLPVRVLMLTTFDLDEYVVGALRAGASGFLAKDVPAEDLIAAIRTVAGGDAVVAPRILRRLLDRFAELLPDPAATPPAALDALTDREREVLVQVARGLSNAEIAPVAVGERDHHQDPCRARADQAAAARPGAGGRAGVRVGAGPPPGVAAPARVPHLAYSKIPRGGTAAVAVVTYRDRRRLGAVDPPVASGAMSVLPPPPGGEKRSTGRRRQGQP